MARFFKIKNWDKFQHYKDRNPPWIKLATDIFQNYDFGRLQDASKLLAICCWTLASKSENGQIPDDLTWIKRQCNLGGNIKLAHLKELINNGFLIDASNPLASCKQSARPETETEGEVYNGTQKFKKPTVDEIRSYCKQKNSLVDADRFWNFYESKGWMVGKNKMKNWKAAVANWEKSNRVENQETNIRNLFK